MPVYRAAVFGCTMHSFLVNIIVMLYEVCRLLQPYTYHMYIGRAMLIGAKVFVLYVDLFTEIKHSAINYNSLECSTAIIKPAN